MPIAEEGLVAHSSSQAYASAAARLNPTYPGFLERLGLRHVAVSGHGALVTDESGAEFVDCTSGYGVLSFGHNHPALVAAAVAQLTSGQPFGRPLILSLQAEFAERLTAILPAGLDRVFHCTSGSEAIDSAMKLARLVTGRPQIIAADGSFHGLTLGALSASGVGRITRPFAPLLPGITHVRFGDVDALASQVTAQTAAVLLEPIQHEAGVRVPPEGYLRTVRETCDRHGTLFVLDEVKTGLGRLGHVVACEAEGVVPDVLVLGKALGGGLVPSGAIVARRDLWTRFGLSVAMSASSYGSNPLACRVGLAVLDLLRDGILLDHVRAQSAILEAGLHSLASAYPALVAGVSGRGLLFGLRLSKPGSAAGLARALVGHGVLAMPALGDGSVLMLEPPLVIEPEQLERALTSLGKSLTQATVEKE